MIAALKWLFEALLLLLGLGVFLLLLYCLVVFVVAAAKKIKEVWKDDRNK